MGSFFFWGVFQGGGFVLRALGCKVEGTGLTNHKHAV